MAAPLWSHLWHCISEGSSFWLAGAVFTDIKSMGCLGRKSGFWKLSDGKEKRTLKTCWGVCLKQKKTRKEPQTVLCGECASVWPFDIRRVRFVTSKGLHYYPPPKKNSPKISLKWAALSATYILSECFSLLHFSARLIWRTLFSAHCSLAFILTLDANKSRSALSSDSICLPSLLISEWS